MVSSGFLRARVVLAALSLILAGCGSGDEVTILKAALTQNPSEPQVRAVQLFGDLVAH